MLLLLCIPIIFYKTFRDVDADVLVWGKRTERTFFDWCELICVGSIFATLFSSLPVLFSLILGMIPEIHGVKDRAYELVSLREGNGIDGRFYLGSGTIRGRPYYSWYRKEGEAIVGGVTEREPCVKVYEAHDMPRMVTYKTAYVNPYSARWHWLIGIDLRDPQWCAKFFLPKNSIREGFVLGGSKGRTIITAECTLELVEE